MIREDIMERLVCFSDEEINNLNGFVGIDKSIFISEQSNVVDADKLLKANQQFAVRKHTRFCEYPKHRHNYLEFMYVYGGEMVTIIDDQEIVIKQGELLLLNQNIEHAIKYTNENDIIFNFIIKPEFLEFLSGMAEEQNEVFSFIFDALYSYDNKGEYLIFKVSNNEIVRNHIEAIITNIYQQQLNHSFTLKLLVGLLLTELMNNPHLIETYESNNYNKLVVISILKYITLNYQEGSLSVLAKQIHQPDYKICKLIKEHTGSTFKQLIQEERLKAAANLLKTTSLPIVEIMQEVGYENITYFYKIFKEKFKITPSIYRNHNLR
ncbi:MULTISPECIES: AraC family transcriptional regulator [Thomasclavelia]|uniref:AraC family transcriptional regulator n=1 Tax=Thomasclavelia TaxID=3025755 RepID=UPI0018A9D1CD|nr:MULTISPECIES: AraC family transcriptional regulator [Thomasclavelia]MCR1947781.1 AraC family transcriptional regulator [Thomasclavelia ramosa]QQY28245.1 helix-turn-helix domain-containing protein [Thomasclavelia ramosa]